MTYLPHESILEVTPAEYAKLKDLSLECSTGVHFNEGMWLSGCLQLGVPKEAMFGGNVYVRVNPDVSVKVEER